MSVKVAVRVRPFNPRQNFLGCICCVEMRQNTTVLYENKQKNKKTHYFTFDYSFWSHDQFRTCSDGYMEPITQKYIDQSRLYNVIGQEILSNAWNGYNCCLFAYGQTGAGKSYSMIGYGANRGIIPMVCQQIFHKIRKNQKPGEKQFQITLSMLEIYNQKVQDLFMPTSKRPQNGLKVRQNKRLGVYVEGLTKHQVCSYKDIQRKMDQGNKNRSLASTLMNEYSSRAHTIVMLQFVQKEWINKLKMNKKSSFINLVDLAGSQRVSKTGILDNKDRLKEASNINKSLHTLGRVIQTLAEHSIGKGKSVQVPYRDSSLTRILQTALGGNSQTIMICAISPANDNYQETLSTLRYADQTKKIKNKPIINQSAVDKIIRQLREENQRLKKQLENAEEMSFSRGPQYDDNYNDKKEMKSNVRASMRQIEKEIKKNLKSFAINTDEIEEEQSLMMTQFIDLEQPSDFFSELSFDIGNKAQVYITNLNEDELLNDKVRYSCQKNLLITNKNNKKDGKGLEDYAKIVLCGLGIEKNHAKIVRKDDRYFIEALSQTAADYTLVNGKPVFQQKELFHNDRIILGINAVFLFRNNLKKPEEEKLPKIDYEFAVTERQAQMQNMAIIPASTMNLFMPNSSFMRENNSKDLYGTPPLHALNASKKLLTQENQTEIMSKISDIQSQFSKLVQQNEQKLKEREDFYKNRLSELRRQKEDEKREKSELQQKLMLKSLQSQALKTKNTQIEALKKRLLKYKDEKKRRVKAKQSMLLDNDQNRNSVIEEDIIGQFVDLQNPNEKQKMSSEYGVGDDNIYKPSKKQQTPKKIQRKESPEYAQLEIQEFQDVDSIHKASFNLHRQSVDSFLLTVEPESPTKKKKAIEEQIFNNNMQIIKMEQKLRKMLKFQFKRLYNIKILSQIEQEIQCETCSKIIPPKVLLSQPNQLNRYASEIEDAQLEELHFKSKKSNKNQNKFKEEELLQLQEQLRLFQAQLIARQARISKSSQNGEDDFLLNYSMDENNSDNVRRRSSTRQSFDRRSSISRNRLSSAQFQLNLSREQIEMKKVVSDFIQILADTPELKIVKESDVIVQPTPPARKELKLSKEIKCEYQPQQNVLKLQYHQISDMEVHLIVEGEEKKEKGIENKKQEDIDENLLEGFQQEPKKIQTTDQETQILRQIVDQQTQIIRQIVDQQTQIFRSIVDQEIQNSPNMINQQILHIPSTSDRQLQNIPQMVDQGMNTEMTEQQLLIQEKLKGNSFTAILNEDLEHSNQTQIMKMPSLKQTYEIGICTEKEEQISKVEAEILTELNEQNFQQYVQNLYQIKKEEEQLKKAILEQQNQILEEEKEQQQQDQQSDEEALENYLQNKKEYTQIAINTQQVEPEKQQTLETGINTTLEAKKSFGLNPLPKQLSTNNVLNEKFQFSIKVPQKEMDIQVQIQPEKKLALVSSELDYQIQEQKNVEKESPIQDLKISDIQQKEISKFRQERLTVSQCLEVFVEPSLVEQKSKVKEKLSISSYKYDHIQGQKRNMIDAEVQLDQTQTKEVKVDQQDKSIKEKSSVEEKKQNSQEQKEGKKDKKNLLEPIHDVPDDFNLSLSGIANHDQSQQYSALGLDGLMKQDELNSKIKTLEQKIKQLEVQAQEKDAKRRQSKEQEVENSSKGEQHQNTSGSKKKKIIPLVKQKKKKKKKNQMTQEERRQYEIQKQLQAKIIQCNNENILNERNIQIHKRKRQAEQLRKILIKKQKVQLQKQLLILIPMVRRFNLISRQMKRIIEGKICVEYRNFSHYEMVDIMKSYHINKRSTGDNIQIKIVILNCEEGRMYIWPTEVFKNRYEIAEQIFQKYLECQDDEISKNRMLQDRKQKAKDPFWDPIDFVSQGLGYLSMQVLLFNLSYQGYISIIYKSTIIAKLYVSIIPVKIKRHIEDESLQDDNDETDLQNIEIGNQRNLLQKEIYFTISIESIKFMKSDERHHGQDGQHIVDIDVINSNIMKYTISYELLQDDYKLNTFTTPQIDFVADKQFKRIDYMRRHSFKNISESTLAYISDCPLKFTLNVMKQVNEECLNLSFNSSYEDSEHSQMEMSGISDSKSVVSHSKKQSMSSVSSLVKDIKGQVKDNLKSDFSKKKNVIFQNTQLVSHIETEAKKQEQKVLKQKKMQEAIKETKESRRKQTSKNDKDKDKDCNIY